MGNILIQILLRRGIIRMNCNVDMNYTLSEHQFWLQIMGDHSRFIYNSLAPTESEYIQMAGDFISLFDSLMEQSHKQTTNAGLEELNRKAYEATHRLREFKIELLTLSITSTLSSSLPPSFFNDMLNELEEYLFVINSLINGQCPLLDPIHYHILWLTDAFGHAASILSNLDFIEKDLINLADEFEVSFHDLMTKSYMMNGYLRTGISNFPSLARLNIQAEYLIKEFMDFLSKLRDQRVDSKILGTLTPLMADHMYREECYYLYKLSQSTDDIRKPDCDPASPRLER